MDEIYREEQSDNSPENSAEPEATLAAFKSKNSKEEGALTVDVFQTEDEIVIKSTVAGVSAEDMDISITEEMVTIKGFRGPDEKVKPSNYYYQELYWGPFSRAIILPEEIDVNKAKASITKNGILTLRLPKLSKSRTKKIKISS